MNKRKKKKSARNSVVLSEKTGYTKNMSIGLTNDVIFKYVFGAKESTHILTDLINAVLTDSGFAPIVSITLKNPITPRATNWLKGTELDILGEDENGVQYDIEMQVSNEPNFVNRSLYYWAKQYSLQLVRGDFYTQLKPVICINLIDFVLVTKPELFHTCYMLQDKQLPDTVLTKDLQIHFVELPKSRQFTGKLADWARLLRESDEYEEDCNMEVIIKEDRSMEEAYERYLDSLRDKRAYFDALMREKWQRDQLSRQKAAEDSGLQAGMERGMQAGMEQGMQAGMERGMEQGVQQGLSQGARQKALEIAKTLKSLGDEPEKIAKATGLSLEEIADIC